MLNLFDHCDHTIMSKPDSTPCILVILTSHRVDCFSLCAECLERYTNLDYFHRILILANDVGEDHGRVIDAFADRHPNVRVWDVKPRGLQYVTAAQNMVHEKYGDGLVLKIDEDLFVGPGWLDGMLRAYVEHCREVDKVLVTPIIPNNLHGRNMLAPYLRWKYDDPRLDSLLHGSVHDKPEYGIWIWEKVLEGGLDLESLLFCSRQPIYTFAQHLNINCILYDYRLISMVHPYCALDEGELNLALRTNQVFGVVTPNCMVHHYSFGPQQQALDEHITMARVARHMRGLGNRGTERGNRRGGAGINTTPTAREAGEPRGARCSNIESKPVSCGAGEATAVIIPE